MGYGPLTGLRRYPYNEILSRIYETHAYNDFMYADISDYCSWSHYKRLLNADVIIKTGKKTERSHTNIVRLTRNYTSDGAPIGRRNRLSIERMCYIGMKA